jgi:hypothetical protein
MQKCLPAWPLQLIVTARKFAAATIQVVPVSICWQDMATSAVVSLFIGSLPLVRFKSIVLNFVDGTEQFFSTA